ncbi:MAG TPA: cytochrome c oxidase subunit II [Vicinamibacterales bacterium]|nr:cytochrome c oxidase subunit II [Vicinamibacterales bacterium]
MRPARKSRRTAALVVALALIACLIAAPSAFANFITPKSGGSPNANAINDLYKIVLYIAGVVFVIVEGALAYSVYRFRAKKNRVAAQIHGNTRLEVGWTVAAALILVVLTVVTFVKLPSIINPPNSDASGLALSASTTVPNPPNGKKYVICVQARQYIWRYTYGAGCVNGAFARHLPYSYTTMYAPAHTTVVLKIQSTDVIHSWWIPSLGGKVDAVPGYTTFTWFKAFKSDMIYRGQCAQLCGVGHAAMVAFVQTMTPANFQSWLNYQENAITAANNQVTQLRQSLAASGNLSAGGN